MHADISGRRQPTLNTAQICRAVCCSFKRSTKMECDDSSHAATWTQEVRDVIVEPLWLIDLQTGGPINDGILAQSRLSYMKFFHNRFPL